jgi:hypothetical protein
LTAGLVLSEGVFDVGNLIVGTDGTVDPTSFGVGGGVFTVGATTIDNTTITGNHASSNFNDVDGTFST